MNVYVTGDAEKLVADSSVLILVPATVRRVLIEEKVVKRDFLMDTVAGLLKQDPNYTADEIAEKMLLDKELIQNIILRLGSDNGGEAEPTYRTAYIVYNQLTKNTYGTNPEEKNLVQVAECTEGTDGSVKWNFKSTHETALVLPWEFEYRCLSDSSGGLKTNAIRAVKDTVTENEQMETVIRNAIPVSYEENCYLLTGIKWNTAGRFLGFGNWSVFSPVTDRGKREYDTGLFLKITENLDSSFKALRATMNEKFTRLVARNKLKVVEKNKDLETLCASKNIEISDALKARILERQRAINDKIISEDAAVALKLYSVMEWELFETLKKLSKSRREKIRDIYKYEIRKPEFAAYLFEIAGLDYREPFFNDYFSSVNDTNITNILINEQAEPSFGVMFICLLINNYIETEVHGNEGYQPVTDLKEICREFMVEFDLTDFKETRNTEKHRGENSCNLSATLELCGKMDTALFGIDFISELGVQANGKARKKVKVGEEVLSYTGLTSEDDISALQSILNNYVSEDSQMYNDCERLLISVISNYVGAAPVYADREERNGKIFEVLKKAGISVNPEWGYLKSTVGNSKLLPQRFCDLIICDGKKDGTPFLKVLSEHYGIFEFIDEINGKIGHTNALFNLNEAKILLEQVQEFIHIIKNL